MSVLFITRWKGCWNLGVNLICLTLAESHVLGMVYLQLDLGALKHCLQDVFFFSFPVSFAWQRLTCSVFGELRDPFFTLAIAWKSIITGFVEDFTHLFICLLSGLLFPELRYGWKMSVHVIPQKQSDKPNLHTFMVIAEKQTSSVLLQISSAINQSSLVCLGNQIVGWSPPFSKIHHTILQTNLPKKKIIIIILSWII